MALDDIRFEEIGRDTLARLADTWKKVDPEAGAIADTAVEILRQRAKYRDHLATADWEIDAWLRGQMSADDDEAEMFRAVAESARDAVNALILKDDLDDADFETLSGPWSEVMNSISASRLSAAPGGEADDAGPASGPTPDEGFGPRAEMVRAFLGELDNLTDDQLDDLTAAFNRQEKEELERAHEAVRALAAESETWRDRIKAAQSWTSTSLSRHKLGRRALDRRSFQEAMAIPPAVDAVTGLVLADVLYPDDARTLYAPWAEVIGEPALPQYE